MRILEHVFIYRFEPRKVRVPLSDLYEDDMFVSETFGNYGWVIRPVIFYKHNLIFKSALKKLYFDCDKDEAIRVINEIAEEKFNLYKEYLVDNK